MDNPFKKRATEFIKDPRAFLPLVSPKPLDEFFKVDGDSLFEKLSMIVGTPGCGKTTIAKVLEFETLSVLNANPDLNRELSTILHDQKILDDNLLKVVAYRLEMSTNFRNIWELPYSEAIRATLLRAFVQSKAVLGWFRELTSSDIPIERIKVRLKEGSESAATIMRSGTAEEFREYARTVEVAIFKAVTALVAPDEEELTSKFLNSSYDAFEEIAGFEVPVSSDAESRTYFIQPMIIIDDAHELHPTQFTGLRDWLKLRTMRVARWIMCRPDAVSPEDYRDALTYDALQETALSPGTTRGRDYVIKLMQLGSREAKRFRLITKDISDRYIDQIPEFTRRSISKLSDCLEDREKSIPDGQIRQLEQQIAKLAKDAGFSPILVDSLRARIPPSTPKDVALGVLRILITRERNRTPQLTLLTEEVRDEPITDDRVARSALIEGARIQLMHDFGRPYYFGFDCLSDASNINIEQFVRLAGTLVDELLAKVIRGNPAVLVPRSQHDALVKQANSIINEWDFPYHAAVNQLVDLIAKRCIDKTLQANAPLDDGANAIGILQSEMDTVLQKSERLARVLHFAFAYKALVYVPEYKCKGQVWCLLELGAIPCLKYGLTLRRGGFLEDSLSTLQSYVGSV